jgi:hypothetical protein
MRRASPRNHTVRLQQIGDALIAAGYTSLDEQAKALGVTRSTAWNIVNGKNKRDRLADKTTNRILANPHTPPSVRAIIKQYLAERSS